jgi:hypothetical protein
MGGLQLMLCASAHLIMKTLNVWWSKLLSVASWGRLGAVHGSTCLTPDMVGAPPRHDATLPITVCRNWVMAAATAAGAIVLFMAGRCAPCDFVSRNVLYLGA